ncbi:unnamed protein product, partial [Prorocentrum cordatum]
GRWEAPRRRRACRERRSSEAPAGAALAASTMGSTRAAGGPGHPPDGEVRDALRGVMGQLLEEQEKRLLKAIKGLLDASLAQYDLSSAVPQDAPEYGTLHCGLGGVAADKPAPGCPMEAAALPESTMSKMNSGSVFQILTRPVGMASPASRDKAGPAARRGGVRSFEDARARELLQSGLWQKKTLPDMTARLSSDSPPVCASKSEARGDCCPVPVPSDRGESMTCPELPSMPLDVDEDPPESPSPKVGPQRTQAPARAGGPGGPDGGHAAELEARRGPRGPRPVGGEFSDLVGAVPAPSGDVPAGSCGSGSPRQLGPGLSWMPRGLQPALPPLLQRYSSSSCTEGGQEEAPSESGRAADDSGARSQSTARSFQYSLPLSECSYRGMRLVTTEVNPTPSNNLLFTGQREGASSPRAAVPLGSEGPAAGAHLGAAAGADGAPSASACDASAGGAGRADWGEQEPTSSLATIGKPSRPRWSLPDGAAAAEEGAPTVQKLRQRREDGLLGAVVHKPPALDPASSCYSAADELSSEQGVGAPLWLRLCGTLPWRRGGCAAGRRGGPQAAYSLLVLALTALAACFFAASALGCSAEGCQSTGGLALATGSLLGLLALRRLEQSSVLGSSDALLVAYAQRQQIVEPWARAMRIEGQV